MHSGSLLYNLMLVFVCFGGLSVMIAFVFLLPAVGNWLVAVFSAVMADKMMLSRKGESVWENEP
ncbi:hypothetical protein LBMAG42_49140 [Deltaproteobacteria bacterium]|nr:hypothetical protein LBMAG42_49140 [Deltaproteobacteria bacterium]